MVRNIPIPLASAKVVPRRSSVILCPFSAAAFCAHRWSSSATHGPAKPALQFEDHLFRVFFDRDAQRHALSKSTSCAKHSRLCHSRSYLAESKSVMENPVRRAAHRLRATRRSDGDGISSRDDGKSPSPCEELVRGLDRLLNVEGHVFRIISHDQPADCWRGDGQ